MTRRAAVAATLLLIVAASRCGESTAPVLEPTVTSVTPDRGPLSGGTSVSITGTRFSDITAVTFGGTPLSELTVVSESRITGVTQAGVSTGAQEVVVASGTTGSGHCVACFTYTQFPGPLLLRLSSSSADTTHPLGALLIRVEGGPSSAIAASGPPLPWSSSGTAAAHLIVSGDLTAGMVLATITVPDTQAAVRLRYSATVRQATMPRWAQYQQLNAANYRVTIEVPQ